MFKSYIYINLCNKKYFYCLVDVCTVKFKYDYAHCDFYVYGYFYFEKYFIPVVYLLGACTWL